MEMNHTLNRLVHSAQVAPPVLTVPPAMVAPYMEAPPELVSSLDVVAPPDALMDPM